MTSSHSSVFVFLVFGILAAAIVFAIGYTIYDWARPSIASMFGPDSPLSDRWEWVKHRFGHRTVPRDEGNDDLDDAAASLLSMLNSASVVIDDHDEVIRANPLAYTLGVVNDDVVVNDRVLQAIHEVREHGGRRKFEVTTDTPERFIRVLADAPGHSRDQRDMQAVSRPNCLKVTVGRIDEHLVVVLLDDVSESMRFAQIRDAFIVNVSEQLLDPVQDLERLAGELERDDLDIAQVRKDAHEVRHSSSHLHHMVSDLLLLIKAQEPVDPGESNRLSVADQLRWVAEQLKGESKRLQIPIVVNAQSDLFVNGEKDQVRAAVTKLVENAMTYSPQGSAVTLSASRSQDGGTIVIRVIDRGIGIPKAEQSRVFERFYRGSHQNEHTADGVGLGLAIVKHVALTHHGTVSLWSVPGQGSTFSLILPTAIS